jgi:PadR family transcriptional regulator PadR
MTRRSNPDFVNGIPELLVLRLLSRKPMYGYQLVEQIQLCSQQSLQFGEGCIYPVLHKMVQQKLLTSQKETVQGRQRIVYHLTSVGENRLVESSQKWLQIVSAVSSIMEGQEDAQPLAA